MLPWVGLVTDHRRRQNVVVTSVTHMPNSLYATFCSYRIFLSSVIYSQTDLFVKYMVDWNKEKVMKRAVSMCKKAK